MYTWNRIDIFLKLSIFLFGILFVLSLTVESIAQNHTQADSLNVIIQKQEKNDKIDSTGVLALIHLGNIYITQNLNRTLELANKANVWSAKIKFYKGACMSYTLKGNTYFHQGNYIKTLPNYQKSLKIATTHHLTAHIAKAYLDLGALYMQIGDFYKSLSYELKAEKYAQELNQKIELAKVFGNIGLLENYMHDRDKAIKYLKESSEYAGQNKSIQALLDNNLGVIYREKNDLNQALKYQLRAKKLREQRHDSIGLAYSYFNIANIYLDKKELNKALNYHRKSIAIRKKLKLKNDLSYSYDELGTIYFMKSDFKKAIKYAGLSYQLALPLHSLVNEQRSLKLLSDIYSRQNNYKTAYNYREKYEVVSDSLINRQKEKKIDNALKEYEINRKSQEINLLQKSEELQKAKIRKDHIYNEALIGGTISLLLLIILILNQNRIKRKSEQELKKKNTELENAYKQIQESDLLLKEQNERLAHLNDEKNEFVHIVAHDLRNPLVGIAGMASIMNDVDTYLEKFSKVDIKTHTQLIIKSTNQMLNLVESLLNVNRIESGQQIDFSESVNISEMITSVVESQSKMAVDKGITIEKDIDEQILVMGNKNSFHQIFDNLLSNALKYSPLNSKVWIESSVGKNKVSLFFRDTGSGISEKDRDKLFTKFAKLSSKPTNNEISTGLGLYITKKLVNGLNGNIFYNEDYTHGSEFVVEFPLSATNQN